MQGLQAATNIAMDLDERIMPRGPLFPRYVYSMSLFCTWSDGWMVRRRRRRRANANVSPAIDAAASTGMLTIGSNSSVEAIHLAPPLF